MKNFLKGLLWTAVGTGAAYAIGSAAYKAGKECGRVEAEYERLRKTSTFGMTEERAKSTIDIPLDKDKKPSKIRTFFKARKIYKDNGKVIKNMINDPEGHRLEAYIHNGELHMHIHNLEEEA